jgi:hypothetical protein
MVASSRKRRIPAAALASAARGPGGTLFSERGPRRPGAWPTGQRPGVYPAGQSGAPEPSPKLRPGFPGSLLPVVLDAWVHAQAFQDRPGPTGVLDQEHIFARDEKKPPVAQVVKVGPGFPFGAGPPQAPRIGPRLLRGSGAGGGGQGGAAGGEGGLQGGAARHTRIIRMWRIGRHGGDLQEAARGRISFVPIRPVHLDSSSSSGFVQFIQFVSIHPDPGRFVQNQADSSRFVSIPPIRLDSSNSSGFVQGGACLCQTKRNGRAHRRQPRPTWATGLDAPGARTATLARGGGEGMAWRSMHADLEHTALPVQRHGQQRVTEIGVPGHWPAEQEPPWPLAGVMASKRGRTG